MTELAIPLFSMIIAIVLNLIPAGVTSFTVEGFHEEKTLHCTKQAGGDWILADEAGMGDRVAFRVDGTKLTVKDAGKEQTVDLAGHLGIDKHAARSCYRTNAACC